MAPENKAYQQPVDWFPKISNVLDFLGTFFLEEYINFNLRAASLLESDINFFSAWTMNVALFSVVFLKNIFNIFHIKQYI